MNQRTDFLVIGSGLAGLSYALKVAEHGHVVVLSKSKVMGSNTSMAQGGIAAVMSPSDSFESHVEDTLIAGAGLCHEDAVRAVVETAPDRIEDLFKWGVGFDVEGVDGEKLDLTREGGHSHRRILHVQDHTGQEIHQQLLAKVLQHPNIEIREEHFAIDLILDRDFAPFRVTPPRCIGAKIYDSANQKPFSFFARFVMLATGGAGKTYLYTSNWSGATGDGIAMAHRAGARIANLEFMQFHPTCLYHPSARTFLITEALRGEGAVLKTVAGESFMERYHPMASLAPRDVVARAIDMEMKRTGDKHVLLDCTHLSAENLRTQFPNIFETCLKHGIDMATQPVPVVPAAHYTCGGVAVDHNGLTSIEGLYAVGEVASTGLHGANRLASNSLLEAVVFAHRAFLHASEELARGQRSHAVVERLPEWDTGHAVEIEEQIDITANWLEIRSLMWNYVGIVRSNRRLERARVRIELLKSEVNAYYWDFLLTPDLIELRNLLTVAELTVMCAQSRKESRGLHWTVDYPQTDDAHFLKDTVIG